MRRFVLLATACLLLSACSSRPLRHSDDSLWENESSPDAAAFLGYHGRVEQGADRPVD